MYSTPTAAVPNASLNLTRYGRRRTEKLGGGRRDRTAMVAHRATIPFVEPDHANYYGAFIRDPDGHKAVGVR
jgi:hypothetical protein